MGFAQRWGHTKRTTPDVVVVGVFYFFRVPRGGWVCGAAGSPAPPAVQPCDIDEFGCPRKKKKVDPRSRSSFDLRDVCKVLEGWGKVSVSGVVSLKKT